MPKPFNPQDKYFHKAKKEGYKARSAFKLEEIQERLKILKSGNLVLDLGAAPGSFLQYTSKVIGENGAALGLDLQEIDLELPNVHTEICDIYEDNSVDELIKKFLETKGIHTPATTKFDVVLSDLAPKTSGQKDVDQWRSVELNQQVLEIAARHLKIHGNCLMKVFQGADFDEFLKNTKKLFKLVRVVKPKAVRDRSFEVYLVCLDKNSA
ncbi:MAG: RlmE family RNA methyltransferase [Candidatus Peregrinibacteria bacterium]|nr:RlmE family RNA methyltransferase [Candidatus Peregrinibacteria bacterium]MDZ4244361.1 RlmE family RNA methyltransferase [Candidatus Gracilibacteria bacterium]